MCAFQNTNFKKFFLSDNETLNIGKKKRFADYSVERELKLSLSDYTNGFEKEEKLEAIKLHYEKVKSKPFNWNEG